MMLNEGERLVVCAALKAQAMIFGEQAKRDQREGRPVQAATHAAYSSECSRIAAMFDKGQ